jgi:hypothetical protein
MNALAFSEDRGTPFKISHHQNYDGVDPQMLCRKQNGREEPLMAQRVPSHHEQVSGRGGRSIDGILEGSQRCQIKSVTTGPKRRA